MLITIKYSICLQDIQIKEQRHAEAEQAIAAKKMALEQNQRKVCFYIPDEIVLTITNAYGYDLCPFQHDVHDATRTEKLQHLHATSSPTGSNPAAGEPGYNNAATGVQGAPVAGGPGYEAGAPARY